MAFEVAWEADIVRLARFALGDESAEWVEIRPEEEKRDIPHYTWVVTFEGEVRVRVMNHQGFWGAIVLNRPSEGYIVQKQKGPVA